MPIHRTDLFAIVAVAWQPIVVLSLMAWSNGILYDLLARYCGIPWSSYVEAKFLLGVFLHEVPLLIFAVYWFRRKRPTQRD